MDAETRELVRRAGDACEYCSIPQEATPLIPFHVEHITAKQHGGSDDPADLALACDRCNAYKGPNLSSIDPETRNVVLLFNPRRDVWSDHFMYRSASRPIPSSAWWPWLWLSRSSWSDGWRFPRAQPLFVGLRIGSCRPNPVSGDDRVPMERPGGACSASSPGVIMCRTFHAVDGQTQTLNEDLRRHISDLAT